MIGEYADPSFRQFMAVTVWSAPTSTPAVRSACWLSCLREQRGRASGGLPARCGHAAASLPTCSAAVQATCWSAKEIYRDKARQTGKPDSIIEKIIEGQINKFYGDICLVEQAFVKDPDKTVQKYLDETGKALQVSPSSAS